MRISGLGELHIAVREGYVHIGHLQHALVVVVRENSRQLVPDNVIGGQTTQADPLEVGVCFQNTRHGAGSEGAQSDLEIHCHLGSSPRFPFSHSDLVTRTKTEAS